MANYRYVTKDDALSMAAAAKDAYEPKDSTIVKDADYVHTDNNLTDAYKAALDDLDATYAPIVSPGLTGTPTAPTAAAGTSTTQIATTAFVAQAIAGIVDGNAVSY